MTGRHVRETVSDSLGGAPVAPASSSRAAKRRDEAVSAAVRTCRLSREDKEAVRAMLDAGTMTIAQLEARPVDELLLAEEHLKAAAHYDRAAMSEPAAAHRATATQLVMSVQAAAVQAAAASNPDPRYGRNPIVEYFRTTKPDLYTVAAADGPAPTLFADGDLPRFTASGVPPADLLRLPWNARQPAARADSSQVYGIFQEFVNDPDGADSEFGGDPGNRDYEQRVSNWLAGYRDPTHQEDGGIDIHASGAIPLSAQNEELMFAGRAQAEEALFDSLHAGSPREVARIEREHLLAATRAATAAADEARKASLKSAGILSLRDHTVT